MQGGVSTAAPTLVLTLVDEGEVRRIELPRAGELTVGRAAENDVVLQERAASRRHARLVVRDGGVVVIDLGSHNGTLVNGAGITGPRRLSPGDVVAIGEASLVVQRGESVLRERSLRTTTELDAALDDELERAARHGRSLALAIFAWDGPVDRAAVHATLAGLPRRYDALAWGEDGTLRMVLPEVTAAEAPDVADRIAEHLRRTAPVVRSGWALAPRDGARAEALLHAARQALGRAEPGKPRWAEDEDATLSLGAQDVIVGDPAVAKIYALVARLARSDLSVVVTGPTGAGKELVALALHRQSPRAGQALVAVNCAAIPDALFESEVFGHERGAFTGAVATKAGLVEQAAGGTLFLDELGELSLAAQAKLLRFLETGRYLRVGDTRERQADVRVVGATCRELEAEVEAGRFRRDLYFRLRGARIVLPPLAERSRELPVLARRFLGAACAKAGREVLELSALTLFALSAYGWPGNVRELRSAMEYVAATADGPVVEPWELPEEIAARVEDGGATAAGAAADAAAHAAAHAAASSREHAEGARAAGPATAVSGSAASSSVDGATFRPIEEELQELERARMVQALRVAGGVQKRAAELLRMPLRTFVTRVKQYGLDAREIARGR